MQEMWNLVQSDGTLKAMQEQEYVIQIEHHKSFLMKYSHYIVKFRPDPETE